MIKVDKQVLKIAREAYSDWDRQIINRIQKFLKQYATEDLEGVATLELPPSENLEYLVILDWQEGYDPEETEMFIKDGLGLNASVRINDAYFKDDCSYPFISDDGDALTGSTLNEVDVREGFSSLAEFLFDNYKEALDNEKYYLKAH